MTSPPHPRRRNADEKRPAPYDVTVSPRPRIEPPTERQLAVRRRLAALSDEHAGRFFAVVRDADRRQREDGDDPLSALERALDQADAELRAEPGGAQVNARWPRRAARG